MKIDQLRPFCMAATLFASACSGGAGVTPVSSTAGSTSHPISGAGSAAKLSIVIPQKSTSPSTKRRPQYVSPSSSQLKVAVNGGTATTYGLSPSTPGCSIVAQQLTCAFSIPAPAGHDSFALSLADGSGNVLSHNVVTATLSAGTTTPVNVTLAAVPASVAIVPGTGATIDGSATTGFHVPGLFAQPIELEALDADGNVIIGPGAPAIGTPTVSGSANVSIVQGGSNDPNAYLLKAGAGTGGQTVSVTASAQGITLNDGTTSSPISSSQTFTYTPAIVTVAGRLISAYSVESGNLIAQWNACAGACSTTIAIGAAADAAGNIYAMVEYIAGISQARVVQIYAAGSTAMTSELASSNGVTGAVSVAFGPNNMLYVLNAPSGFGLSHKPASITEYATGATSPTYKISGSLAGLSQPVSVGVDSTGNVYESDSAGYINVYAPGNQTAPSSTLTDPSLATPSFMVLDKSGGIYVDDSTNEDIAYFAPGSTSVTATLSDPSFQGNPQQMAFDANGNMWLSVNNNVVEELSGSALPNSVSVLDTIAASGAVAWVP